MALIICPECGNEVSERAQVCIHCGYPLAELNSAAQTTQTENKSTGSTTPVPPLSIAKCPWCNTPGNEFKADRDIGAYVCSLCGYTTEPFDQAKYGIYKKKRDAKFEEEKRRREQEENTIRCPKCNSTAITTNARGVNGFWGFIGASKTVNRCAKCGYTWEPKV